MDSFESFEIYVPEEAEVKTVPLTTLPKAILRQMGVNKTFGINSRDLARLATSLPEGTCISPVVIRKTGGRPIISQDDKLNLHIASKKLLRARKPALTMPFVISNLAAHKVLSDLCGKTSNHHTNASPIPRHSTSQLKQDAVIIYRGQIYLSLKKITLPMGSHRLIPRRDPVPNTAVPSPAIEITSDSDNDDANTDAPAAIEITSASDDDSQEEAPQFCESSPEPLKDALQKKAVSEQFLTRRCRVKLIRIPRETLNRLLAKTQMDSVSSRECYGTHENHKTKKNPAGREDNGPAADLPSNSDMEQADTVLSESDPENPGEVRQRKTNTYVLHSETSSSGGETQTSSSDGSETLPFAQDTQRENNASDSDGNAMDGNNNAVDGENDAGDCGDIAMVRRNNVDSENNAEDCGDIAMVGSNNVDSENNAGDCGDMAMAGSNNVDSENDLGDCDDFAMERSHNVDSENDAWAMDGDNYAGDSAMSSQSPASFSRSPASFSRSPASFSMDGEHDVAGGDGGMLSVAETSAEVPQRHVFTPATAGGQHQNFDFDQLAREEQLASMRAKVKEKLAALNNLL